VGEVAEFHREGKIDERSQRGKGWWLGKKTDRGKKGDKRPKSRTKKKRKVYILGGSNLGGDDRERTTNGNRGIGGRNFEKMKKN